ncbi:hypothetical protein KJS94_06345 [Flavihumibacter rivuli]|uniref:hypothetical protein n=1 Tax=Flavihumibacter rivuli TaxID=2838156 RepID=UPI001BDF0970|nr:hypothetical protein [Flavihumibacter rivuli]ULQ57816.1 hypothetical protein KJS94_06345 [Flavihumibacter rivuli]
MENPAIGQATQQPRSGEMIYQYVVTIQNRGARLIDRFSFLLSGISVIFFLYAYLTSTERQYIQLAGGLISAVLIAINLFNQYRNGKKVQYKYIFLLIGLTWVSMPYYPWISVLFILLGLVETQAKKDLEIGFADDRIVFNTLPRKTYQWSDLNNVVLRGNLLTLDFTNNRLFQRETVDEEGDADEDEFNHYCEEQLRKYPVKIS